MDFRRNLGTAVALTIVIGAIALAEQEVAPKVTVNEDVQARNAAEVLRQRQMQVDVATLSYRKLKFAVAERPGAMSDEVLSKVSLQVLQLETAIAKSREEGIKAATAYLGREGRRVQK